jgi:hypothetical protein
MTNYFWARNFIVAKKYVGYSLYFYKKFPYLKQKENSCNIWARILVLGAN